MGAYKYIQKIWRKNNQTQCNICILFDTGTSDSSAEFIELQDPLDLKEPED